MKTLHWLALGLIVISGCAKQHHARIGDLELTLPWSKEVPSGAPVAAGFLSIRNQGDMDDRLIAVRSDAAARVEIHEIRHEGGMMRMRKVEAGLPVPAGATVNLKPGGYHLMFITPGAGFVRGGTVEATLVFERAGPKDVRFEVRPLSAAGPVQGRSHHAR
ncbi:hypothetical protein AO715_11565 [Xanthomonas sp. Mitacek01]|nr:hypothetical protein AO715_11565 [Xanthomonas sp. Mitacek01]